jgi:hypothetical protein
MSDVDVKASVRERDGFKCQDCGMTNEQHNERYGKQLDVHRLIPGCAYSVALCVTLCRACHSTKPKQAIDALYLNDSTGVRAFFFNLYDPPEREIVQRLDSAAACRGVDSGRIIMDALTCYLNNFPGDYVI